ncbi:MAG: hypothetical protein WBF13_09710 [Candidatus Zixiibacteriota bacterium]
MKIGWREFGFAVAGFVIAFLVQEYAIQRHELIKGGEKEALKQKIERENQILIERLEEDWEAFKDSVEQVFIKKKRDFKAEKRLPPKDPLASGIELRFNAKRDIILTQKRKEIDRKIEDLRMRLDF